MSIVGVGFTVMVVVLGSLMQKLFLGSVAGKYKLPYSVTGNVLANRAVALNIPEIGVEPVLFAVKVIGDELGVMTAVAIEGLSIVQFNAP